MPTDAEGDERPARPGPLIVRSRRTLRSVIPISSWLPRYRWSTDGPADLIAGIAIAALLIPESMGYAGIAGVPAEVGLYAALGAVVLYAITGGTSVLVVGPASAVAALSASVVDELGGDGDRVQLVAALAMASGVLLLVAGALRLGWIVNFISRPVLHAFVAGLSISIIIGQLDGLFRIDVEGESAVGKLADTVAQVGDWHPLSVIVGVGALALLLVSEELVPRLPAAVLAVVVGIVLVVAFGLDGRGVEVVGDIPQGLPEVGIPDLGTRRWLELFAGATALLLVGFSEGYAAASSVASSTGEEIDADQELVGAGAANIGAGLLGGIPAGGSLSKSAAAQNAGARSQMANLVAGAVVLATLLFLAPVFEELPEPVLSAIVIVAVLRSADPRRVVELWHVNHLDFAAGVATFVLVLVWETLPAMIVGVLLSLAFLVRRASFPDVVELRRDADGNFRRIDPHAATTAGRDEPTSALIRFEAPLLYANAERLLVAARTAVRRRPGTERLVIDAEMIADLDASGADVLRTLDDELAERGIEVHLVRPHHRMLEQIERSNLAARFETRIHAHVGDAVAATDDPSR